MAEAIEARIDGIEMAQVSLKDAIVGLEERMSEEQVGEKLAQIDMRFEREASEIDETIKGVHHQLLKEIETRTDREWINKTFDTKMSKNQGKELKENLLKLDKQFADFKSSTKLHHDKHLEKQASLGSRLDTEAQKFKQSFKEMLDGQKHITDKIIARIEQIRKANNSELVSQTTTLKDEVHSTLRKAEKGILNQVNLKLPDMLHKYYRALAETRYGKVFLENEQTTGFESVLQALISKIADDASICLDTKAQRNAIQNSIQAFLMEELTTEMESVNLQLN